MTKRKFVDVTVSWCNDECVPTTKVSLSDWEMVRAGEEVSTFATYWYDGKKFDAVFSFNYDGFGTLLVGYNDGGQGFIGNMVEAHIVGGEFPSEPPVTPPVKRSRSRGPRA